MIFTLLLEIKCIDVVFIFLRCFNVVKLAMEHKTTKLK